jgi:hypothetical protein
LGARRGAVRRHDRLQHRDHLFGCLLGNNLPDHLRLEFRDLAALLIHKFFHEQRAHQQPLIRNSAHGHRHL